MQKIARALVVYSPASGRSAQLSEALDALKNANIEVMQTLPVQELTGSPAWREQNLNVMIAAGGDGVIGTVINQIVPGSLPLGIMPLGTANDIARSLNIPLDLNEAARTIASGQIRRLGLGKVRRLTTTEQDTPGYFAHVLTVGLNVQFARVATNLAVRQRYGRLTYPVAALEALRNPTILPVDLRFEGLHLPSQAQAQAQAREVRPDESAPTTLRCQALQVTVINAPVFGGAWQITLPGSTLDDDFLDIVVFEEAGLGRLVTRLASFFSSPPPDLPDSQEANQFLRHPAELTGLPGIHHLQAHGLILTTGQDPQPVTLDGEIWGETPLRIELARDILPVLAPGQA